MAGVRAPRAAGYAGEGPASGNYNGLIGTAAVDPISGTIPLRSYLCQVRRATAGARTPVRAS